MATNWKELEEKIGLALEDSEGVWVVNSPAFFAACDKYGIEPGYLADAIGEVACQEAEDRAHDHWGVYD